MKLRFGCIGLLLAVLCAPAFAAKQYYLPAWKWCLYDCGNSGDYDSPSELITAYNAYIDQQYNTCVATAQPCGGGCYKINRTNPTPTPGFAVVNGISTFQLTASNISTYYGPTCGSNPATTTVTDMGGASVAAYGKFTCPKEFLWGGESSNFHYETINGQQTPVYGYDCLQIVPEPQVCKPQLGNSISPIDQAKIETVTDYSTPKDQLRVTRAYTSAGSAAWTFEGMGAALADFTGRTPLTLPPFAGTVTAIPSGFYYSSAEPPAVDVAATFSRIKTQPDTGLGEVWISLGSSKSVNFVESSPGVFSTAELDKPQLLVSGSGSSTRWTMIDKLSGYSIFDQNGALVSQTKLNGSHIDYTRSAGSVVVTSAVSGRTLTYALNSQGQVSSVTVPAGPPLTYGYGSSGTIESVGYPDLSTRSYLYGESAYIGGLSGAGVLLTGQIDENQQRLGTYTYDGSRSAIKTERAGGQDAYMFNYPSIGDFGTAYVTGPNGANSSISWDLGPSGERRLDSQSQPAGSGCTAASQTITYDTAGNVQSRTDFDSYATCYAFDTTRNVEVAQVSGLTANPSCASYTTPNATLPAGSRKTSTQWHPDWRLAGKVASPLRLTTWVYNGQPDPFNGNAVASCAPSTALLPDGKPIAVLCKQVEQATTDGDGHLGFSAALQSGVANRVQSWTYNAYGQVLTAKGARTDVNDTTTYVYYSSTAASYTKGDLQQVTNAAGQVTQFPSYNKHGQVLRMIDPNGVITDSTYDLRLRLLSATVGGLQTTYAYDLAGQLKKVTLPDTTVISYSYDPAHRLTQITDQAGNSVTYILDNAGNRTREDIKNSSGTLARTVTRAFDALNRVQNVTGAIQ